MASVRDLNLEATELRLGPPGIEELHHKETNHGIRKNKRAVSETNSKTGSGQDSTASSVQESEHHESAPPAKAKIVGWPPVRTSRKNNMQLMKSEAENAGFYVKVSMDGAPYLRKIDLNLHNGYSGLIKALEDMFNKKIDGCNGSASFVPTYEDKDGDWMLVGDVPWNMFITSCERLRIMKGSEARGLGHMA